MLTRSVSVLALLLSTGAAHAQTVHVQSGTDLQSLINTSPPGTVFMLHPGEYRQQQLTPKNGMVFRAVTPRTAVFIGSKALIGWRVDGRSRWFVGEQTQRGERNNGAECRAEYPRCNHPEDLFMDGVPLRHVNSRDAVGPGRFFFDYQQDRVYIGDNPIGKVFEAAVTPWAFGGAAKDVTIEGLTIKHYATRTQEGTVRGDEGATGWIVRNNTISWNHSLGVDANTGWKVIGNRLERNGMAGYGGGGNDLLFEGNVVANNNYAGVNAFWEGGGGKITESSRAVVRGNCVYGNDGPGIWFDENANSSVATGNTVFNNAQAGIFFEISYGATISGNTVFDNGHDSRRSGWFWEPQILVSSAQGARVENNTVQATPAYGNGITIVSQNRKPWTPAINNVIRNNRVILRGAATGRMGAVTDVKADIDAVASRNMMSGNTYHVAKSGKDYWNWRNDNRTLAQMQDIGQENGSTINTVLPPPPSPVCQ